jgi:superfamily II DNA/RNA helicase
MERILQRGGGRGNFIASAGSKRKSIAATRALILTPTRELAAQCLGMMTALVQYTHITSVLIVGGSKNVGSQVGVIVS